MNLNRFSQPMGFGDDAPPEREEREFNHDDLSAEELDVRSPGCAGESSKPATSPIPHLANPAQLDSLAWALDRIAEQTALPVKTKSPRTRTG